jgi:serine/threonine-protein kinase RsbW
MPSEVSNFSVKVNSKCPQQTIIIPAQFESLDNVCAFVTQQAESCGLEESAVHAVELSVDEAVSNIIEHSYGGECLEDIEVTCQLTPQGLVVTLKDCGQPFDPSKVPDPNLTIELQKRQVGGLGFYFMHRLMDEVAFTFIPGVNGNPGCNILKMVKHKLA